MPLQCRTYGLHQNHLLIDSIWKGQPMRWKRCSNAGQCWCEFWGCFLLFFPSKRKWFNVSGGVRKLSFCSWTLSLIKIILGDDGAQQKSLSLQSQIQAVHINNKHIQRWRGRKRGGHWRKERYWREMFSNKIIIFTGSVIYGHCCAESLISCCSWVEAADSAQRKTSQHGLRLVLQTESLLLGHRSGMTWSEWSETIVIFLIWVTAINKQVSISKEMFTLVLVIQNLVQRLGLCGHALIVYILEQTFLLDLRSMLYRKCLRKSLY